MKFALFSLAIALFIGVAVAANSEGDAKGFQKSIINGIGWGVGREITHQVMRHIFH